MRIAEVFLNQKNKRIDLAYDYQIPQHLEFVIKVGMRVVVQFGSGNRRLEGFVVLIKEETDFLGKIKAIIENIDSHPVLNKEQIELCLWMKTYYCSLFYEALSYFTMSVKIKQEIYCFLKKDDLDLDLKETWFVKNYFNDVKEAIFLSKVKPEDRIILTGLIKKDIVWTEKRWKTVSMPNENDISEATMFRITELGRKVMSQDKKIGKNQRVLLNYLLHRDMSSVELKMLSTQFEKSLNPLIKKNFVENYQTALHDRSAANSSELVKKTQSVILTSKEQGHYRRYEKLAHKKDGVFFHVFDGASKYRLFFKAIEDQLTLGKSAVVIFPEVNMTFQRMEIFYKYFGDRVGICHGRLTPKQRADLYNKIKTGELQVVIGVRSALFLPFKNLGLIIIDDEHDPSHINISTPKFHISDIAKKASEIMEATYLLADAMPRITTWYQIQNKELSYIQIGDAQFHRDMIQIIDMQNEMRQGNMGILSRELLKQMRSSLEQKRLGVLFINNKGYANSVFCRNCGHFEKCPNCGVSLKYYNHDQALHCHYCGYKKAVPQQCPVCSSDKIRHMGFGIEQLEEYIKRAFPDRRIETVQGNLNRTEIKRINKELSLGEIDFLIGTQVIIKHFNFVNVGVAAAVLIDRDLNQGNYQAAEIVYQTYSRFFEKAMDAQTIGLIQTNEPDNETIYSIKNESYQEFYRGEIKYRELMKYPPIINMISFSIFQPHEKEVENDAFRLFVALKNELNLMNKSYEIYKPVRIGVTKGGNVTYQIVLKLLERRVFQYLMSKIIKLGIIEELKSKVSFQINL